MKANEVMIGDWVEVISNDHLKYVQIAEICQNSILTKESEFESEEVSIDNIKPIPLTPEILEKNGFKKIQIHGEKQDDIFQCIDGEIIIDVGLYDPNFIWIHYRYETPDGINSGELSSIVKVDGGKFYLHELQHALKLCGIEKTILITKSV